MSADTDGFDDDFYRSHISRRRLERRRRLDRRAQVGVVLLAIVLGVVAGMNGTPKTWAEPQRTITPVTSPAGSAGP